MATPPPYPPPQVAQEEVRVAPVYEARRYTIGEALVAAGAPIPKAQAMGTNYNARMQTATGLKAAAWLEERGWTPYGRKWCPPSADILD